jgi:ribonuclease M5
MSNLFKEVVVVEGNHDASRIRQIFKDIDIITTNGSEISDQTLDLLKKMNETRGLILLLDPDFPGQKIRNRVNDYVGETKHVFIEKRYCIDETKRKVGIEHAPLSVIEKALKQHIHEVKPLSEKPLTIVDMVDLKLVGTINAKLNRKIISEQFHLGSCNAKTMLKRLNMFAIKKTEIEKVLL